MPHAERRQCAGRHHCHREPNAETQHEPRAQSETLQLQTKQQDRDRRRARHQSARQAEHDDLAGRDITPCKSLLNATGVRALVGVLIAVGG